MPWHNIHLGKDEGTHTDVVTQPLADPDRSFPWLTCLPVPAWLPQLCHLPLPDCTARTDKTSLTFTRPHPQPALLCWELATSHISPGAVPQKITSLDTPKTPGRHEPPSSRAWTPREHLTLHSHQQVQAHPQCQTQPGAARARGAPSEQGNPNRTGTEYKGWPTPLFLFPLLPSLPQASRALGAHGAAVDAGAVNVGFFPLLLFALHREKAKHTQSKCWHPSCHSTAGTVLLERNNPTLPPCASKGPFFQILAELCSLSLF